MGILPQENLKKTVFLETFGCQMNESDSERLLGFLSSLGYEQVSDYNKADLIMLNTCSVRDKAEQKVYSALGRFRPLKETRPGLIIALCGCVAQQQGEKLLQRIPYLDLVIGTNNIHKIGELLLEARSRNKRVAATSFSGIIEEDEYRDATRRDSLKAFVSIMRGCDNYCSYCIVPYTRGHEVSRKAADIIDEIKRLCRDGVREVMLLGQNVNSYRDSGAGLAFVDLLRMVARIEGIWRIRFVTSHPRDLSPELIRLFGEEEKLCRHLHLPVQSGSDRVLKLMRRGYKVSEYLGKAAMLQEMYPDMALTTDIIVGFPGETEEDFEATMALIRRLGFDNIFSFMYSSRPGTLAAGFEPTVPLEEKKRRLAALQALQSSITLQRGNQLVGSIENVLVEGASKLREEEFTGRTSQNRVVNFSAPIEKEGSLIDVQITEAYQHSLRGTYREWKTYAT
ncbi:MAG: tRNA (N6-isopentenyl adenosine(37)-C2)-methylthiotransferase MiaB [Thermodesulfobacteriota bacterium]